MILQIIRILTLVLLLCNISGFFLVYLGAMFGTISSYITSALLLFYYFFIKSWHKPALPFLFLTLLYFSISGFSFNELETSIYVKELIRFTIVVVSALELLYRTKKKELIYILLFGALSIIVHAFIFPESNRIYGLVVGRFSGFYLNPNTAASICLIGFALSYSISKTKERYLIQFVFTLAGILTLSRTFILVWLVINLVAIFRDKRNLFVPMIGALVLTIVLTFSDTSIFAADRFEALESFFDEGPVKTRTLQNDSRTHTWSLHIDRILDKPLTGNGYLSFQRRINGLPGVHNTFLMVLGESGILPFLVLVAIYGYLLTKSIQNFKLFPELLYVTLVLILALMVGHTYFFNFFNVVLAIYVYVRVRELNTKELSRS